ncbi:exonuclease domain-containing protein [Rhodococcus coprophilus]|uniref:DNA polymerase III n=1 Tax=Rhodococcus coprophilus TaxID=38310 RepID=A0A2X4TLH7_9NOCA|nr:exonuclease domain-containing protein [Rhodococcus coprophilus]MBM7460579.1 DNA polymerase-3 subunit epsilon [Rhodococcus coprophilus]SQI28387.1 DNA polymerase III [Rhodococcus coprophilus]
MSARGLSFAAFDVETANADRGSICAIGVVVVRDGILDGTYSWECRPPAAVDYFSAFNTSVHGITGDSVAGAPRFGDVWPQVLEVIGEFPLVSHNAAFDTGAVRKACDHSGLPWPVIRFGCTMVWARRHLDLVSYRLPMVSAALGVELVTHHDAAADAAAAAGIALELAARTGSGTIDALAEAMETRIGRITETGWDGCRRVGKRKIDRLVAPGTAADVDPDHPLYGQVVAFTGGLMSMTRQGAMNAVARCGATAAKAVTRRTTLLVIGDGFTGADPSAFTTGKAARASELRAKGFGIEVLTENDLLELLAQEAPTESPSTSGAVSVPPHPGLVGTQPPM